MIKEIIQIGNEILLQESEPIEEGKISDGKIQSLIQSVRETLLFHEKNAAGLSAVQIGELKTLYAVKLLDEEDKKGQFPIEIMINPQVKIKGTKTTVEWEGCMSINSEKGRLFGPVFRPKEVIVSYLNEKAEQRVRRVKNFFSHLIQHEQDHLEGKLFLQYVKNPKNIWNEGELDKYLKQYNEFPPLVK